jgi:hypothetical protein
MQSIIESRVKKAINLSRKGYDEFGENGFIRHGFDLTEQQILDKLNELKK